MSFLDYLRPVSTISADKTREFLKNRSSEEFNLLDVRQPGEYEQEHLPGAQLVPVADLDVRIKELDPSKPTITY